MFALVRNITPSACNSSASRRSNTRFSNLNSGIAVAQQPADTVVSRSNTVTR